MGSGSRRPLGKIRGSARAAGWSRKLAAYAEDDDPDGTDEEKGEGVHLDVIPHTNVVRSVQWGECGSYTVVRCVITLHGAGEGEVEGSGRHTRLNMTRRSWLAVPQPRKSAAVGLSGTVMLSKM